MISAAVDGVGVGVGVVGQRRHGEVFVNMAGPKRKVPSSSAAGAGSVRQRPCQKKEGERACHARGAGVEQAWEWRELGKGCKMRAR